MLCEEWALRGNQVRLITQTFSEQREPASFEIFRRPGWMQLLQLMRWCDLFYQCNISLRTAWPLLIFRRPWMVTHCNWIGKYGQGAGWRDWWKIAALRGAYGVAVSHAIAGHLPRCREIIPPCYPDDQFFEMSEIEKTRDIVFMGRLVSDKGADTLLEALQILAGNGRSPRVTIIGRGPEEETLRAMVRRSGMDDQIRFAGTVFGPDLRLELNRHHLMVVPSRWAEPYPITAIDGIACGLVVVGSDQGGLPDAIGECGMTFPNGNAAALAGVLETLLSSPESWDKFKKPARAHLLRHRRATIGERYLQRFERMVREL